MSNFYGIQTATTPSWTVTNGMSASVIDATGAQTIHIASGGSLDMTGSAGANHIYFDAYNASQLTVERSGMTVIFKDGATEVARISASSDSQSIHFLDATSALIYNGTIVTLGGAEVTTTASVPTILTVTNTGGTVTLGGTATGTVTASLSGTDLTFSRGGTSASAINVNDVTSINLPDAGSINVAFANSLDTANITFHSTDTVAINDTGANIGALTATAINGFNDVNINAFNASDNAVTMNVAQANAIDAANMTFHATDAVTIADTGANIGALTATAINGFNDANINAINASDNAVVLNVAQANAIDAGNISFDATDAVTVVDTGANIGALTATAINGFNDANINAINASDNAAVLNVAQANAVDAGNISFDATDAVTVVDTGANIGALTATAINGFNDANINAFNASDNAATLNVTTANAIDSANLVFDATDAVTVNVATGEEATTLVSAVIGGYDSANINNINLADEATTLNVTTANAIDTANIVFDATDAVTVDIATGEEATTLVSAVIVGYDSANINNINLADNLTGVNVATANAIDTANMVFDATDTVTVADTGANIGGVTAAAIGGWNSANINVINASDNAVTLNVAQANAIDTANITFDATDAATVADTGANIGALTATAINGFNDANINGFNASDDAVALNVLQANAFAASDMDFDATDALTIVDTGANIGALTATAINGFSGININASDNAVALNVTQANAIDAADLVFHATDAVTVNVATGEEAATLVSAVIGGYDSANINNINLADNATTLNVTTANAIDTANMVFDATDAVTVDIATGEEATTLVSAVIGGYDSANINNINLADNATAVNVATANAIDTANMVFDATDAVTVVDTGANIGGVTAAAIGGWNSANINAINASDNAVTLNVAQANAVDTANITFDATDTATVADTGANIGALTATAINGFNDANINAFNASDNAVAMNVAQAGAVVAGGMVFDATDTLTIADTGANIGALTATEINEFVGVNINASDDAVTLNVAQANAVDATDQIFHSTDTVTVNVATGEEATTLVSAVIGGYDTANINNINLADNATTLNVTTANAIDTANMVFDATDAVTVDIATGEEATTLVSAVIGGYDSANINNINLADNATAVNVATANAIDTANMVFDATDTVAVADTGANIGGVTAAAIGGWNSANINAINASDDAVTLNVAQANAIDTADITFDATDTATVADTGANIGALTATAINGFNDANINAVNTSDNAATLNVTQANAIDAADLVFHATDAVTVNVATGEEAATLVSAVIGGYDTANINNINLADEATTLNVTTANAIDTANMVFDATDAVTVDIATGEEATTLVSAVIGGYDSANINNINLADNATAVNVATANAIDTADMVFDATDTVAVADTGANIGGVTAAAIGGWNSANINVINASDDAVVFNVAQANAIDTANIIFNATDTATVADTGANIGALTATAINGFNDANINAFNASDNAITMNLAQAGAIVAGGMVFDATDTLTIADTGANIGALSAAAITGFTGVNINASDDAVTLNVTQANAIDASDLVFHATDAVTVNVATGEEATTLVSAVIGGYDSANINNINLADDATTLNVTTANAIDTANMVFDATDAVTVDIATGEEATTLVSAVIGGYDSANINNLNLADNATTLNVTTANAIDTANMVFDATDAVTVDIATGEEATTLVSAVIGGYDSANINNLNLADNATTLNVTTANAIDTANMVFDATDAVTVDIATGEEATTLVSAVISGYDSANINNINLADDATTLNVTTANAVDTANMVFDATDVVTVDIATGEEATTLVSAVIGGYDSANINSINLADNATAVNVATANAIDTANMVFDATDAVTVEDTGANIGGVSAASIGGWNSANINTINASDDAVVFNVAQANAVDSGDMVFDATDTVTVVDTGANIGGISTTSIAGWNSANINAVNASDNTVTLTVAQANAIDTTDITFDATDTVTVADTGANIGALTATAINGFNDANINAFNTSDDAATLNVAQANAVDAANMVFHASDVVTVDIATGEEATTLVSAVIGGYDTANINNINLADNATTLNVTTANAIDTANMVFDATDAVTVDIATGEEATTLVSAVISGYDSANINNINLADNATTLNVTTANAIDTANMVFDATDAVTVDIATGEEATTLVSAVIGGYDSANINNINLADDATTLNVTTANAIDTANMVFDATDAVTVDIATGEEATTLVSAVIGGYDSANINNINLADDATTLNVTTANAIDTANMVFDATDAVTVDIATGEEATTLVSAVIGGYDSANINNLNLADNATTLDVANANAIDTANMVFDASDVVTVDIATGEEGTTLVAAVIGGYDSANINNINLADDATALDVTNANAIDAANMVFDATDVVTVADALNGVLTTTVVAGWDAANINALDSSDGVTIATAVALALDTGNIAFVAGDSVTVQIAGTDGDATVGYVDDGDTFFGNADTFAIEAAATLTVADIGLNSGDVFSFSGAQALASQAAAQAVADGQYMLIRGSWAGGVFTVNTGAGADTLVLFDSDAAGTAATSGIVLVGIAPAAITAGADQISIT